MYFIYYNLFFIGKLMENVKFIDFEKFKKLSKRYIKKNENRYSFLDFKGGRNVII